MFGKNEIVGQKYFADAKDDQLFVTSMFMTLQGEGPYRGQPAFFIRLAKCNLACSFCDTFFDDGDWLTFDQIEQKIDQTIEQFYIDNNLPQPNWTVTGEGRLKRDLVLVITGGEPMLQKNLGPFLERMEVQFESTQIESNGILCQDIPKSTTLVVSPKCAEKDGVAVKYLKPNQKTLDRADCLKFVMEADPNSPYSEVPDWALEWKDQRFGISGSKRQVFVSPMNIYNDQPAQSKQLRANSNRIEIEERSTVDEVISFWDEGLLDMEANQRNHEYAARYCVKHGLVLNLQIHLYASLA